jgi:predicted phage tail protein
MISGSGGGKSGGSGGGLTEQADTLKSTAYAQVLDLICEGEIGGLVDGLKSIYLDDVPIQNPDGSANFTGVQFSTTTGTQTQSTIAGFDQVANETVVGVEATVATGPVVRTVTNTNVTSVVVTIQFPALTYLSSEGNLGGTSVQFAIDLQVDGGGWITKINQTITGKSSQSYERQFRIPLPIGTTRDIRVRRITADSTSSQLNNKTFFQSYTQVIDAKLRYPNSALVAMRVDASQFRAIPRRGYDVKLLKIRIPSNASVRADGSLTYFGNWNGQFQIAWSSNPAWCFYDLLTTERYGCGNYIEQSQIDKWALYQIGQYCDELIDDGFGGVEPRFSCNVWINTRQEAYKVLQDFASVFRGMTFWGTGVVTAVQDAPKDAVFLFTNANVIGGEFAYQGSSAKARHTIALVTWNDPDDMYRQKIEYVEDTVGIARYGIIESQVVAFACSSRGQAHRVGKWMLYTERYETEICSFKTGLESAFCRPGDIIKVADQYRAGNRLGGRIVSATSLTVTVDSLASGAISSGGDFFVVGPDGRVQQKSISSVSGNTVTLTSAFNPIPTNQSVWVASSPALEAQTFRVLSMVENESGEHEIVAVSHRPDKYDAIEQDIVLEPRTYSSLSPIPDLVASISMSESLYRYQNDVRAKVTCSWPAAANASRYRVEWRLNDNNFTVDETGSLDYEILNTTVGKYEVRITPIGVFGTASSAYTAATINTLGKTAPPANVAGFNANVDPWVGIVLSWQSVPDLDIDQYEIRQGASWAAGTVVTRVLANTYKVGAIFGASQTYWIKAIDTSGNFSLTEASTTTTISSPSAVTLSSQVIDNNVLLRWSTPTSTLAIDYFEIRKGSTWAGATVVGRISSGTFATIFETASATYTYWIAGVDIGGNVGAQSSTSATVAQPPDYQLFLNQASTFNGVITNGIVSEGSLWLAVDTTETITTHFTSRAWSTPQDQITAGSTYFIQPTQNTGSYEEVIDYGTTLASAKVTLNAVYSQGFGSSTVTPNLAVANATNSVVITVATPAVFTKSAHGLTNGQTITLKTTGTLPVGLVQNKTYYVINAAANTFNVSLTSGGAAIATSGSQAPAHSYIGPYTEYAGVAQAFATNFRWTKYRYDVNAAASDDIVEFDAITVNIDVKQKSDFGSVAAVSTDAGGTTVTFNASFVSVTSIQLTPNSTTAAYAIYDFTSVPNPTTFKVLLFNSSGTRISGTVGWQARGY